MKRHLSVSRSVRALAHVDCRAVGGSLCVERATVGDGFQRWNGRGGLPVCPSGGPSQVSLAGVVVVLGLLPAAGCQHPTELRWRGRAYSKCIP